MAATLKDISRETGINLCSVSQVLNDHPRAQTLRKETRERILETASRLGYSKNQMAAAIGKKHSNVLAFVHSDMGMVEYTGRIQNGVNEAASKRGYTLTVHPIGDSPEKLFRDLIGWRVAGVIFHVAELSQISGIAAMLEREKIPYGTVNLSNPGGIGVTTDDAAGIEEAVRILHENNHKRPLYVAIAAKKESEFKEKRREGFERGLKKYYPECRKGLTLDISPEKMFDRKYMTEFFKKLQRMKIDSVICESDIPAVSLNNVIAAEGSSVPEVFSLIGFGGSILSETSFPKITTIVQDFEEMGKRTADAIIAQIGKKNGIKPDNQLIPVSIAIRDSLKKQK